MILGHRVGIGGILKFSVFGAQAQVHTEVQKRRSSPGVHGANAHSGENWLHSQDSNRLRDNGLRNADTGERTIGIAHSDI